MKISKKFLVILFISLLSSPSWSETMDDLVFRDGISYLKFSDVPFTGKVTGRGQEFDPPVESQGSFKNGKREGAWVYYHDNGQLWFKSNFKNGKEEGAYVRYYDNGQLDTKGNLKNGKEDGAWVYYHDNGQLWFKSNFKNGKEEGAYIAYHENGQLQEKGNYENGKREGDWVEYTTNGERIPELSGIFKNGIKISD